MNDVLDPLAAMLLESVEAEEVERVARHSLEERVASVERKMDKLIEVIGTMQKSPGFSKQGLSVTVMERDSSERIKTLLVN